jgi:acyl-CoA reductase-like NAD-dependent aldehyde dehydrogenase
MVPPSAPVFLEEIFGPVVTIITFDTEEDAIKIANATEYGLQFQNCARHAEAFIRKQAVSAQLAVRS